MKCLRKREDQSLDSLHSGKSERAGAPCNHRSLACGPLMQCKRTTSFLSHGALVPQSCVCFPTLMATGYHPYTCCVVHPTPTPCWHIHASEATKDT